MYRIVLTVMLITFSLVAFAQKSDFSLMKQNVKQIKSSSDGYYLSRLGINPFSPVFENTFGLNDSSRVLVYIMNNSGQIIKSLFKGVLSKGVFRISWENINEEGDTFQQGIYFLSLEVVYPPEEPNELTDEFLFRGKVKFLVP